MYVIKGMNQCSCWELDNKEGSFLVDFELPGGKRKEVEIDTERVEFFIPARALSG
jgi:hypothetical protein